MGIDQKVEAAMKDSQGLKETWSENRLELVLLWTAIINRYDILHMTLIPFGYPLDSPALRLPADHPSETIGLIIAHVQLLFA
ncbi:uncharacterized protein I206_100921 [Kwoniella pini CBS 10737]|uniref:Uncharacterized protein n=1 Tax=Kwoniella pini CBS 10737 TaxID=1296096 RepID=A0A1B9ICE7_9TREE|nr:uncharacterized protein I206_00405 [Kwoniella pini CBS 10737]OCF53104.1 hypothetical protein I206_00405 [Kwoniella pini CBS 10737]